MPDCETYTITLTDAANKHETRPIAVRLQALLKLMQRGFGLRCTDIQPTNPDGGSTWESEEERILLE